MIWLAHIYSLFQLHILFIGGTGCIFELRHIETTWKVIIFLQFSLQVTNFLISIHFQLLVTRSFFRYKNVHRSWCTSGTGSSSQICAIQNIILRFVRGIFIKYRATIVLIISANEGWFESVPTKRCPRTSPGFSKAFTTRFSSSHMWCIKFWF